MKQQTYAVEQVELDGRMVALTATEHTSIAHLDRLQKGINTPTQDAIN